MWRRVYFAFPGTEYARRVVTELERGGVPRTDIHTIARESIDIGGMPTASDAQKKDEIWLVDRLLWGGSLILFTLLLVGCLYSLTIGSLMGVALTLLAAIGVFLAGARFAMFIPHVHLSELRVPLMHGEVVLMVDVPRDRVKEIIALVSRDHPEVGVGGVGWTPHIGAV
jgi:hypothetical protein